MRRLKEVQDAIAQTNEEKINLQDTLHIQKTRVKAIAAKLGALLGSKLGTNLGSPVL